MGWRTSAAGWAGAAAVADQVARSRARAHRRALATSDRSAAVASALEQVDPPNGPFVAIVMAALNEADSMTGVLEELPVSVCGLPVRTVVVDDGSSDDTAELASKAGAIVARHDSNLGQGDGLGTGFALALGLGATVIVTMDADGQHDPSGLTVLVSPVVAGEADYVQGSRFLGEYDDATGARHAARAVAQRDGRAASRVGEHGRDHAPRRRSRQLSGAARAVLRVLPAAGTTSRAFVSRSSE